MLDGLALARRGPLGDGAADEENKLPSGAALEIAKVADIGGISEHDGVTRG